MNKVNYSCFRIPRNRGEGKETDICFEDCICNYAHIKNTSYEFMFLDVLDFTFSQSLAHGMKNNLFYKNKYNENLEKYHGISFYKNISLDSFKEDIVNNGIIILTVDAYYFKWNEAYNICHDIQHSLLITHQDGNYICIDPFYNHIEIIPYNLIVLSYCHHYILTSKSPLVNLDKASVIKEKVKNLIMNDRYIYLRELFNTTNYMSNYSDINTLIEYINILKHFERTSYLFGILLESYFVTGDNENYSSAFMNISDKWRRIRLIYYNIREINNRTGIIEKKDISKYIDYILLFEESTLVRLAR